MYHKKTIRKIITLFIISMICVISSRTVFAEETQISSSTPPGIRYVTSSEVNLVFNSYLSSTYFKKLADKDTVTKSELYNVIMDTYTESNNIFKILEEPVPVRIILELTNNPEELITEDELFMYIEQFEKTNYEGGFFTINDLKFMIGVLFAVIAFKIVCVPRLPSMPVIPNYHEELKGIKKILESMEKKDKK